MLYCLQRYEKQLELGSKIVEIVSKRWNIAIFLAISYEF